VRTKSKKTTRSGGVTDRRVARAMSEMGSKPVRLRASTSRLQFPSEPTLLTDVDTSHLGQFQSVAFQAMPYCMFRTSDFATSRMQLMERCAIGRGGANKVAALDNLILHSRHLVVRMKVQNGACGTWRAVPLESD
jgi:hypothetical protein